MLILNRTSNLILENENKIIDEHDILVMLSFMWLVIGWPKIVFGKCFLYFLVLGVTKNDGHVFRFEQKKLFLIFLK